MTADFDIYEMSKISTDNCNEMNFLFFDTFAFV